MNDWIKFRRETSLATSLAAKQVFLKVQLNGKQNVQLVLPNELNDDVGRFTTHHQTCLVTNQVVARCEKLLWKVESSSTFYNKICSCCAFYRPNGRNIRNAL